MTATGEEKESRREGCHECDRQLGGYQSRENIQAVRFPGPASRLKNEGLVVPAIKRTAGIDS